MKINNRRAFRIAAFLIIQLCTIHTINAQDNEGHGEAVSTAHSRVAGGRTKKAKENTRAFSKKWMRDTMAGCIHTAKRNGDT